MFIIVGGTGHIGSAVAGAVLEQGQPVTVVTRKAAHGEAWRKCGAGIAVADVRDVDGLRDVFRRGRRAFLLNPPADPATDTDRQERETVRCLIAALDGSGAGERGRPVDLWGPPRRGLRRPDGSPRLRASAAGAAGSGRHCPRRLPHEQLG